MKEWFRKAVQDEYCRQYYLFNDSIAGIIVISVIFIILETVNPLYTQYTNVFVFADLLFTAVFLGEYVMRLAFSKRPLAYAGSTLGIIDLLSFLPSLLLFVAPVLGPLHPLRVLRVIRVLRLMRLFRMLKLLAYTDRRRKTDSTLLRAIRRTDIEIYLFTFISVIVISGTLMYLAESGVEGTFFTSIPQGMWWAMVTVTTVGYGDIIPLTAWGKLIAALTMMAGLVLIALLVVVVGKTSQSVLFGTPVEEEEALLSGAEKRQRAATKRGGVRKTEGQKRTADTAARKRVRESYNSISPRKGNNS